ncbi:MAG: haloacid dehalogenase [Acidobacteria bacterium]|nr:MAG: haloacid dehalogenase [Acidobacteriota bacterium]
MESSIFNRKPAITMPAALIFDMDGVLVDSNPFHLRKWIDLLNEHGIPYDPKELPSQILGHRNDTAFRRFFGPDITREESRRLSEELEATFRESHRAGIPMAVASSAMTKNVEFIVDALGFRPYFRYLVTGDEVSRPKPDPEIYLKAARKLDCEPAASVAFEDSFVGIEAAKRAGMKCVAIASTFPFEELEKQTRADLTVTGFEEVDLERLGLLFKDAPRPAGP